MIQMSAPDIAEMKKVLTPYRANQKGEIARSVTFLGVVMLATQTSAREDSVVVVAVGLIAAGDVIESMSKMGQWSRRREWLFLLYVALYILVLSLGQFQVVSQGFTGPWVAGIILTVCYSLLRRNLFYQAPETEKSES